MKTFTEFIKEENAKIIEVIGYDTFLTEKIFFAEEVIKTVERWQALQQTDVIQGEYLPCDHSEWVETYGELHERIVTCLKCGEIIIK